MEQAEAELVVRLDAVVDDDPLLLWVLAALRRWEGEMTKAAKATLRIPFPVGTRTPKMNGLSAADYVRLQEEYAAKCAEYDHMDRTLSSVLGQIEERVRSKILH